MERKRLHRQFFRADMTYQDVLDFQTAIVVGWMLGWLYLAAR